MASEYNQANAGSIVVTGDMVPPQPPTASDTRANPVVLRPTERSSCGDTLAGQLGVCLAEHEVLSLGRRPLQALWSDFMTTVAPNDIGETRPKGELPFDLKRGHGGEPMDTVGSRVLSRMRQECSSFDEVWGEQRIPQLKCLCEASVSTKGQWLPKTALKLHETAPGIETSLA